MTSLGLVNLKRLPPALFARDTLREAKTALRAARPLRQEGVAVLSRGSDDEDWPVARYTVPAAAHMDDLTAFSAWVLRAEPAPQGVDSFYVSPNAWLKTPLAAIIRDLPQGCGLKISKSLGDVHAPYMTARAGRRLQRRLSGSHAAQVETFRYLHARGVGPKLHSILELVDGGGAIRVCYVVEHIEGVAPSKEDFTALVSTLQDLCAHGAATLVSGSGWSGRDFQLPDGNGNAIASSRDGCVKYIDVHSFRISRAGGRLGPAGDASASDRP